MSSERKDVRFKVSADVHRRLVVLAEIEDSDIALYVERLVEAEVNRRVHTASLIASRAAEPGVSGNRGE